MTSPPSQRPVAAAGTGTTLRAVLDSVTAAVPGVDELQDVVEAVADLVDADRVLLISLDEGAQRVTAHVVGGPGRDRIGFDDFSELMDGLTGWAVRTHRTVVSPGGKDDMREGPGLRERRRATGAGAVVVVPMRHRARDLGTLTAVRRSDQADFAESEVADLEAIGTAIAVTLGSHSEDAERAAPTAVESRDDRLRRAFGARDPVAIADLLAEDARWVVPGRSALAGTYRGRGAVFDYLRKVRDLSDGTFRANMSALLVGADHVAVLTSAEAQRGQWHYEGRHVLLCDLDGDVVTRVVLLAEDPRAFDEFWR